MYVGPKLIVDIVSATNVKIQKSRNSQSQVVHVDKLKVCRWEAPTSRLFIDDREEDVIAASEDEGGDESTLGDGTGNGLADPMDGKQHTMTTGSTSAQLDDASTRNENEDGISSSRPTRQRQPPPY